MNKDLTVFEVENIKTYDKNGNLNEGIREIAIEEVIPNPDQPRKNFDPEAIKELSKTVKKYGLIQPIIATLDRDKYVIVAGERRYRAAQVAGLKTVPVIVKNLTRKQIDEIALIDKRSFKPRNKGSLVGSYGKRCSRQEEASIPYRLDRKGLDSRYGRCRRQAS